VLVTDYNLCLAWYGWESLLNSGITPDNINTNPCLKPNLNTVYISTQAGGGIQYMQGTSMATPVVAGAFSALRQKHPNASVDQLLGILQTTGTPLNDNRLGYTFDDAGTSAQKRLINLGAALSANQAPIISNFTGPTERVNQNATVNLLADVANATSCSLNNNIGNVAITSGKINVDVPAKASYELTCANELNDTDSATLTLNINTAPSVPGSPDITNIDKSTGSFTIRWKASTDSDGVSSYRVSLDGKLIKTVNGDVLEYRFSDVDLSKEHTVTIEAVDSLGAISEAASFEVPAAKEDALIAADEKFEEQGGVAAAIASGLKSPNGGFSNILPSPIMVLGCGVLLAFGVTISRYKLSRR
jgi:hypothetical protein